MIQVPESHSYGARAPSSERSGGGGYDRAEEREIGRFKRGEEGARLKT